LPIVTDEELRDGETGANSVYDTIRSPEGPVSLRRLPTQVRRSAALVWTAARSELLLCVGLEVLTGIGVAVQLLIGRSILDVVVSSGGGRTLGDLAPQVAGLAVITTLVGFAGSALGERRVVLAELVEQHVQGRIIDVVTAVELEAFDRPTFYDRLQRAKVNAAERSWRVVFGIVSLLNGLTGIVALGVVLLSIQPVVLPLVLLACAPLWLATRRNNRATYEFAFSMTPDDRERSYLQAVLTNKPEAKEIRQFGSAGFLRNRYDRIYDRRIADLRGVARKRMSRSLVASAGSTAVTMVGVAVLLQLTLTGHIGAADAAVAAVAIQQLGSRLRGVNSSVGQLHECSLFLADLESFLDLQDAVSVARPTKDAPPGFIHLAAQSVGFFYPGSTRPALEDVSIEVRRHEVVALVGRNGSGKTTLAKVLCGLYRPTSGRVLWDGLDIAQCDPEQARKGVTAIFQDFVHYELPARDNVALGDTERFDDLSAIQHAARLAGVDKLLADLPNGYDTRLTRAFEGGTELSVGQWQRIALARAFFRDSPFLILDEPTAALDAGAEAELFRSIRVLQRDRSVLLVSHRFSSVRSADRIYVLDGGRVIESGDHAQLMALQGRYAELFTLQASAYVDLDAAVERE
jgi:ATP-binding cassette subfamily B protein